MGKDITLTEAIQALMKDIRAGLEEADGRYPTRIEAELPVVLKSSNNSTDIRQWVLSDGTPDQGDSKAVKLTIEFRQAWDSGQVWLVRNEDYKPPKPLEE